MVNHPNSLSLRHSTDAQLNRVTFPFFQAGIFLSVDEEHVVTFAPPATLIMLNGQVAADIMAAALYIQNGVVVLAFKVGDTVDLGGIDLKLIAPALAGIFSVPL